MESPQILNRWSQTPYEGVETLSGKCGAQEVFDDSHLSGKIKDSQTHVQPIEPFADKFIQEALPSLHLTLAGAQFLQCYLLYIQLLQSVYLPGHEIVDQLQLNGFKSLRDSA